MKKDLKTLALARLSGFRHKTVRVPEWENVSVVLREPSAEAWYLWREVLNDGGTGDEPLSVGAKKQRETEEGGEAFRGVRVVTCLASGGTGDVRGGERGCTFHAHWRVDYSCVVHV
ncbi:phage tail assembly chaperone, partial [Escherichia coli]|uniref:phage tail assembly chaperone n=1 Tax=Escherichia coli TaxID=562 RepID=UPI002033C3B9